MLSLPAAANIITQGGVVCFPTETVFGIGANAYNASACKAIYNIKKRALYNPLIVHVSSLEDALKEVILSEDAMALANEFWPGPLTLVANRRQGSKICDIATAGLSTIAVRLPAHAEARELIKLSNVPIAAPSANYSGMLSNTDIVHLKESFSKDDLPVLDATMPKIGIESTVIDVTPGQLTILRHGSITQEEIEQKIGKKIITGNSTAGIKKSPGMDLKHYSPRTKLMYNYTSAKEEDFVSLNFKDSNLKGKFSLNLSVSGSYKEACKNLYYMLNELDRYAITHNIKIIAVAPIPKYGLGVAINDKLYRASK